MSVLFPLATTPRVRAGDTNAKPLFATESGDANTTTSPAAALGVAATGVGQSLSCPSMLMALTSKQRGWSLGSPLAMKSSDTVVPSSTQFASQRFWPAWYTVEYTR